MKKFIVSSDSLAKALKSLAPAVASKPVIPVMSNILCKVMKGKVEVVATDLELTISCLVDVESKEEFEVLLPFDFLNKVLGFEKNMPLTIEHPSSRKIRILGDGDAFEISVDKIDDFPKAPRISKGNSLALDADFIGYLGSALATVSKDDLRPAITNVCLDIKKSDTTVVSTDGYTMYMHRVPVGFNTPEKLMLSSRLIACIAGLTGATLTWDEKNACISDKALTVICRRFDGKYPDYRSILPDHPATLAIDRSVLIDAFKKTSIGSTTADGTSIELKFSESKIRFVCANLDHGLDIKIEKAAEYTGDTPLVQVDAKKMLTVLGQIDAEKLDLHIGPVDKAILIKTQEDTDYTGLIMPIFKQS